MRGRFLLLPRRTHRTRLPGVAKRVKLPVLVGHCVLLPGCCRKRLSAVCVRCRWIVSVAMGTTCGAASRSRSGRVCRVGVADGDAPARLLIAPDARPRPGLPPRHRPARCPAARRVPGRTPHAASRAPTDSPPTAPTGRHHRPPSHR